MTGQARGHSWSVAVCPWTTPQHGVVGLTAVPPWGCGNAGPAGQTQQSRPPWTRQCVGFPSNTVVLPPVTACVLPGNPHSRARRSMFGAFTVPPATAQLGAFANYMFFCLGSSCPTYRRPCFGGEGALTRLLAGLALPALFTAPPTRAAWAPPWAAQPPADTGSRGPRSGGPQPVWCDCVLLGLPESAPAPRGRDPGPGTQDPPPEPGAPRGSQKIVQHAGHGSTPRPGSPRGGQATGSSRSRCCWVKSFHFHGGRRGPATSQGGLNGSGAPRRGPRSPRFPPVCGHPLFIRETPGA